MHRKKKINDLFFVYAIHQDNIRYNHSTLLTSLEARIVRIIILSNHLNSKGSSLDLDCSVSNKILSFLRQDKPVSPMHVIQYKLEHEDTESNKMLNSKTM
jgi:hypothetical protein